jgi:hypothetical protein
VPADQRAGWSVRHIPIMSIVHHAGKAGRKSPMAAQETSARRQYAFKHFSVAHRSLYLSAIALRHALRAVGTGGSDDAQARREAARRVLRTPMPTSEPHFCHPPGAALSLGPPGAPTGRPPSNADSDHRRTDLRPCVSGDLDF